MPYVLIKKSNAWNQQTYVYKGNSRSEWNQNKSKLSFQCIQTGLSNIKKGYKYKEGILIKR